MAAEKLISLDAVTKKLEDEIKACPVPDPEDPPSEVLVKRTIPKLLQDVIDYLKKQPTVEVVRCKNCIYFHKRLGVGFGRCSKTAIYPYEEDFCSYGERRTDV